MIVFLSTLLSGCDGQEEEPRPAPQVGIITIEPQHFELATELPGRTTAFRVAEIRPQVTGIIKKRLFTEGSEVEEGQQLYQIDDTLYKATFDSAKADLAKALATVKSSRLKASRYKELVAAKAVSQQDYDDAMATLAEDEASVAGARASVDTAQANLAYTKVFSPISGRIGKSSVTEGALVTDNQTTSLTTVTQLDPIYVDLTQSSTDLLTLRRDIGDGRVKGVEGGKATVTLKLLDSDEQYVQAGQLQFSDVTVSEDTGTVKLRAIFPNAHEDLLPGLFVRAIVAEGSIDQALLVPQQALTRNPDGSGSVWLVGDDNKVKQQTVTTAQAVGDKWLVTEGLKAGDRIVMEGLQKISADMVVNPIAASEKSKTEPGSQNE
ncbi:MAG: efflux RND transporter periplasmic adaptor subunit [Rhizobiales bacterium]|nr:efflux RND transporter periplasmic adaptor subunit [Hyphomicrobiales bacterium]